MNENKTLVEKYIRALSGHPKLPNHVAKYVADKKLAQHISVVEAAFPQHELVPEQIVCEGDMVVIRGEFRGVHLGPFGGIDATGRSVSAGLIVIYQVQGQKIVNHWMQVDTIALLLQLQVIQDQRA